MRILGWDIQRAAQEQKTGQFEDVLQRIVAAQEGRGYGSLVTPENCMASPTVHAIVTAISRRLSVSPVHVFQKTTKGGLDSKERLPKHPVARLLAYPNSFQTRTSYWLDAASTFTRYGNFYAYKSRAATGPVKELLPIQYRALSVEQNERTWKVSYKINGEEIPQNKIHHVRGAARNFIEGDSPVNDVNLAIGLEILAEKFGASFFQNGALPFLVFTWLQGSGGGYKNPEDAKQFIADFQEAFGGGKRFRAMLAPKGMDKPSAVPIENDKAQFLETRKYQRTVIAGAFGVPPHLVGDLERATFNNVEQQDLDFTSNVIQPVTQAFESAMERDLLTDEDVSNGVIIRFNLDAILRSDFKGRQEGLQIQKQNGAINANEWREIEGLNPISDEDGGNDYVRPANFVVAGEEPEVVAPADPIKQLDESIKNLQKAAQEMS